MKPRKSPPGDRNTFGHKIVEYRKINSIKQKDLLAMLQTLGVDITATRLSNLEGQYCRAREDEIRASAKIMKISIGELLGESSGEYDK